VTPDTEDRSTTSTTRGRHTTSSGSTQDRHQTGAVRGSMPPGPEPTLCIKSIHFLNSNVHHVDTLWPPSDTNVPSRGKPSRAA